MCGIAGFIENVPNKTEDRLVQIAQAMGLAIRYRGPDDDGVWVDASRGLAFSHRRLAIVDLSAAGVQPMSSSCGRYVIIYNGEIYNHNDLRHELSASGIKFVGHSDTEVIIEGCALWGVKSTLKKLNGMFAFALWDQKEQQLTLVRDRLGIKPLYWTKTDKSFIFGSELKALRQHPDCSNHINRDAVAGFLRHNYIASPNSIYIGIQKLEPGWMLSVKAGEDPVLEQFWSLDRVLEESFTDPFLGSEQEATESLHDLLYDAVGQQMIADVPLGAFLSGGIDSSAVVALMQAQRARPIRTFSIGLNESDFDEAKNAAEVARHLGTDHTELYVSPNDARDIIPDIPKYYDEPFSDSSQIPTFLVSQMTREHVKVALSGDGGDELFSGYNRYIEAAKYQSVLFHQPKLLRKAEASAIRGLEPSTWNVVSKIIPSKWRPTHFGDKLYKLASILSGDEKDFYGNLVSHWQDPNNLVIGGNEPIGLIWDQSVAERVPNFIDRMQYLDTLTYLPNDILTKVDRASMAVSLEVRVPLLDHRIVDFAWKLPRNMKIKNGKGKWLLRQVLYKYVPKEMIDRPKMGFGIPLGTWLRQPLRDWAEDLLSTEALNNTGLLKPEDVRKKWSEHLSGRRNWEYLIWDILMLQSWHNHNFKL